MKDSMVQSLLVVLTAITMLLFSVNVSAVSGDARRHYDRAMAAVEMATAPVDYEKAIVEFEKAKSLAPNWPDVYYNLGMAQEKAGKYDDAATNLKQYLRLAPKAKNAAFIKSHINKLEYKAEQTLTPKDYTDIFVSLSDENSWTRIGDTQGTLFQYSANGVERVGDQMVRVVTVVQVRPIGYKVIKIETGKIRHGWILYRNIKPPEYPLQQDHEIEIVSRSHVKIKTTMIDSLRGYSPEVFTWELIKK